MQQRKIGPFDVSAIGLGCMSLSHAYGSPPPRPQAEEVLLGALDAGYTFFDTAAVYGLGHNETLVGEVLSPHRAKFTLASKCGITDATGTQRGIDGRPETIKALCDVSLRRLKTEVIDLYYLHRWDKKVPVEDSVGELSRLVSEGKIKEIGLSEVSAATLEKAHAVHPVAALQTEYSLMTRNPEVAVLDACARLGVAFVAFSPVGRGILGGMLRSMDELPSTDLRYIMPRFNEPENFAHNLALADKFAALAREAGVTPGQLSIAWTLTKGEHIIAIPGTANPQHLADNLAAARIVIEDDLLARMEALINNKTVRGPRYPPLQQSQVDTEEIAA